MLVMPAVAILVAALVGDASSIAWDVTQLQIAVPPMVMAGLLAARSGLNTEVATFTVGAGTLLAFATLPLMGALVT
jgi:predicted permease